MADNSVALQAMSNESINLVYIHHHSCCLLMTFVVSFTKYHQNKDDQMFLWIMALQENAPLKEVFEHFTCTREGLSSDEVQERLTRFGYNRLEEKKVRNEF